MATFPTPTQAGTGCCANAVRSVAFDAVNNRLWFVQNDGIVGWANPSVVSPGTSAGMVDRLLPYPSDLWDVAIGVNGLAWSTEHSASNVAPYPGDRIASIDAGLSVHELDNIALQGGRTTLDSARYDAQPAGITTAPDGTPWFAEANPGLPGYRIAAGNGSGYSEYAITPCAPLPPCSGSYTRTGPTDVAVALDGSKWFTNQLKNEVGRLDPGAGTFTNYSLPAIDSGLGGGQARAISLAPDGTLWVLGSGPDRPARRRRRRIAGRRHHPRRRKRDAVPGVTALTPASVGTARVGTASTHGTSVTVDQICVGPPQDPCTLVYILSSHDYVAGFPGSHARAAAVKRPKPVVLGTKTVTLHGGQHKKVTITLNAKGRKLLKRTGRLQVFFTVTQARPNGASPKRLKKTTLTFKAKRR
jgi:hypothetical protein